MRSCSSGRQLLDHAGQARGEDVHAVHEPLAGPSSSAEDSEAEVAVVALLRGLQGAPAGEGFWRGLGLGLWRSLGHGHGPLGLASFLIAFLIAFALGALVVAVLAELFLRCRQESPSWRCSAAGSGSRSRPRCERPLGWSWASGPRCCRSGTAPQDTARCRGSGGASSWRSRNTRGTPCSEAALCSSSSRRVMLTGLVLRLQV